MKDVGFDTAHVPEFLRRDDANNDGGGRGKVSNPKDAIADSRIPLWLCSPIAKIKWALAQYAGLLKYGAWNWREAGVRASVYTSAIHRHIDGFASGEDNDPIDGTDHLGNIMACCALLIEARAAGKMTDDRPPMLDHRPTIAEGEALIKKLKEQYKDRAPRHWTIADSKPTVIDAEFTDIVWTVWEGGLRPVAAEEIVCIRLRDGSEGHAPAADWVWSHDEEHSGSDIVAYRVVSE